MDPFGFLRLTAASIKTTVANPEANAKAILEFLKSDRSDVVVFPELTLSGYTCGELFLQDVLLEGCLEQLQVIADECVGRHGLFAIGLPYRIEGRLYNMAAVLNNGRILGLIPKQYLPNYQEFYKSRWFVAGDTSLPKTVDLGLHQDIPLGIDLLFKEGPAVIGVEICEDLWMPVPPSSLYALAGANVLLNLSASNETIGKAPYRAQLVSSQSGRCCAAYAYSSSGPGESTTDLVFGGHCLIAEGGSLLAESLRVGSGLSSSDEGSSATVDIDLQRLGHDRQQTVSFHTGRQRFIPAPMRVIPFDLLCENRSLRRSISGSPFVPGPGPELEQRCREVFEIQCAALTKRVSQLSPQSHLHIGVSGGLDSTLALLVAVRMCQQSGESTRRIHGITMPGFGTSSQTLVNALNLMKLLDVSSEEIDIQATCIQLFSDLKHKPFGIDPSGMELSEFRKLLQNLPDHQRKDLVFENVQARVRTMMLMSRGFVLGTGDLSEQALGWCTYNGDHMSMYNVNCSIPKTLVRFLVRYVADHVFEGEISEVLHDIADTPISPELLPLASDSSIHQATEASIGPYELQDFFLYHFVRTGASPEKLRFLASQANFSQSYSESTIDETLAIFLKRFFANQFKRSCVPDGPKVGSVSLSPRGDWRMPSDASVKSWLDRLEGEM